jgi:hypothetical protein
MTPAQQMLYFREWGRVRDVLKAKGLPCGDVERHKFHLKALGVRKSSKDFTNADFDKVLAAFKAITEPGNLTPQIRAMDQPMLRNIEARARCMKILEELEVGRASTIERSEFIRGSYLDGIVRRLTQGKHINFSTCDDRTANAILHTLHMRLLSRQRAKEKALAANNCPY